MMYAERHRNQFREFVDFVRMTAQATHLEDEFDVVYDHVLARVQFLATGSVVGAVFAQLYLTTDGAGGAAQVLVDIMSTPQRVNVAGATEYARRVALISQLAVWCQQYVDDSAR